MRLRATVVKAATLVLVLVAAMGCSRHDAATDRLDAIHKAGVLRVASFDSNPPFGYVDAQSKKIVGLDVDYAEALAHKLGVRLEIVPTNPANRIALLASGKVDLVIANFTITQERAKQVEFSIPYFASGQQFIAPRGKLTSPAQLNGLRIGVDKGTVNEINLREKYPSAVLVAYDDTPFAFAALRSGNVQAISQDGPKLIGILAHAPDASAYEIPAFVISQDLIGIGIPKGQTKLKAFVDGTLVELEKSGEAERIYNRWFGPQTKTPLARTFRIGQK
jgi:polar amino acid transport system substrate-binding protein